MTNRPNNVAELLVQAADAALNHDDATLNDLMAVNGEWVQTEEEMKATEKVLLTLSVLSGASHL